MKNTILVLLAAILLCSPLAADMSSIYLDQGTVKLKAGDFLGAKALFKKALQLNPDNAGAWERYDEATLKLDALEKRTKKLILTPKFDIQYDEIKINDINRFQQKYIKISGTLKNLSDLSFEKLIVKLVLIRNERQILTLEYLIENLKAGSQRTFTFNKLVPAFTSYEIKTQVIESD